MLLSPNGCFRSHSSKSHTAALAVLNLVCQNSMNLLAGMLKCSFQGQNVTRQNTLNALDISKDLCHQQTEPSTIMMANRTQSLLKTINSFRGEKNVIQAFFECKNVISTILFDLWLMLMGYILVV